MTGIFIFTFSWDHMDRRCHVVLYPTFWHSCRYSTSFIRHLCQWFNLSQILSFTCHPQSIMSRVVSIKNEKKKIIFRILIDVVRTFLLEHHVASIWSSTTKCVELTTRARIRDIRFHAHDNTIFDLERDRESRTRDSTQIMTKRSGSNRFEIQVDGMKCYSSLWQRPCRDQFERFFVSAWSRGDV